MDAHLRVVIQKAALNPAIELPAELAGSVDNAGINVQFCGTETTQLRAHNDQSAISLACLVSAVRVRSSMC